MTIEVFHRRVGNKYHTMVRGLCRKKFFKIVEVTRIPNPTNFRNIEVLKHHLKTMYPGMYEELFLGRHIKHIRRWNRWQVKRR